MEELSRQTYSSEEEDQVETQNLLGEEEEYDEENEMSPASAMARSLIVADKSTFGPLPPEPKVSLVTKIKAPKAQQAPPPQMPWSDFLFKARLAYEVFFPPKEEVYTPAKAVKSRLQMILVSDRSGLDLPTLNRIKDESLRALAEDQGWEDMTELELQVASIKPNGEEVKVRVPLASIPNKRQIRDSLDYIYEEDEDDEYEEEEDLEALVSSSGQWGSSFLERPVLGQTDRQIDRRIGAGRTR